MRKKTMNNLTQQFDGYLHSELIININNELCRTQKCSSPFLPVSAHDTDNKKTLLLYVAVSYRTFLFVLDLLQAQILLCFFNSSLGGSCFSRSRLIFCPASDLVFPVPQQIALLLRVRRIPLHRQNPAEE